MSLPFGGLAGVFQALLEVGLPVFVVANVFYPLPPLQERAIFVLLITLLVFFRDLGKAERNRLLKVVDGFLAAAAVVVFGYVVVEHDDITRLVGIAPPFAMALGVCSLPLVLELTRRTLGLALTVLILAFLGYGFWGQLLPRELGGHGGFEVDRVISVLYLGTEGIFGEVTYVVFKYVFLFVLLGKVLESTGALWGAMRLARAAFGRFTGGPALVSVASSALEGTVTGSAVANVMVSGSLTIPLMRGVGFRPEMAAAVEAVSSTGGQIMPPVMGAAAFIMAALLGIPYMAVVRAAVVPAVLYFLALFVSVYVYARRTGLGGVAPEAMVKEPSLRESMGVVVTFVIGLGSLWGLLIAGYSPIYAALWAMAAALVTNVAIGPRRVGPRQLVEALMRSSRDFMDVGVAGPSLGIIVGVVLLTGLASRLSEVIVGLAGGNEWLLLVLTMVAAIVLGTGLPTSVAYVLLAITVAPALVRSGFSPVASHLFIFYFGMLSMVTPPVALAAYAAAGIAKADVWRTGVRAFWLAVPGFLIPYSFILNPALLLEGPWWEVLGRGSLTMVGMVALAMALTGTVQGAVELAERCVLTAGGLLLLHPAWLTDLVGLVCVGLGCLRPGLVALMRTVGRSPGAVDIGAD